MSKVIKIAIPFFDNLYTWPNKNFLTLCESLMKSGDTYVSFIKVTPKELLQRADYDAVFLLRGGGSATKEYIDYYKKNNILISIWHDDIYCLRYSRFISYSKELINWFRVADIFFLPYVNTFLKFKQYRKYINKVVWLPWSVPDLIMANCVDWSQRKDKILLSGKQSWQYPLRNKMLEFYFTDKGQEILFNMKHQGYHSEVQKDMITGQDFYEVLQSYKGGIATCALRPINFHVAKYIEISGCGCLPFMEYTPDLSFLGFTDGINCIVIDRHNYLDKFEIMHSEKAIQIANNAREIVRQRHLHSHRSEVIKSTIVNKLRLR